ncbi:hypothetical protein JJB07_03670 [Tumebacillus sp. ITR2]|uniref:Copper resistance protein D domain-containing protein n=1 Tax=Tumebacillus amylolyticus TaxID=2801339 RepID=A0ABS1J641_9BACL|nr:hypothetical protein [Tumebacillus amylolyticus]MBL0385741.1 hypothetical protein [Tumebacillus amylolyticus]
MLGFLYFLHLTGLTAWIGSMVLLVIMLVSVRKNLEEWNGKPLFLLATRLVKWLLNGAALAVLISGVGLIQKLGFTEASKPFYVKFMEQTGGLTLLLFIILMTLFSNRATKQLKQEKNLTAGVFPKILIRYSTALTVFVVLGLAVLFVVSNRY